MNAEAMLDDKTRRRRNIIPAVKEVLLPLQE
jgi:hypothetical protein